MRRGRAKVLAMAARLVAGEWPHNPPPGRGVCWRKPGPGVFHALNRLIDTNRDGADLQSWDLDSLGNWNSTTTADGTETRTFDAANQITGISVGVTPTYDLAGNMTSGPSPADSTTRQHYTYDAWNRLVAVHADADGEPGALIASYAYDGQNHRIQKTVTAGESTVTQDTYYNAAWQLVETFNPADSTEHAVEAYVWDLRYIDSPVVRLYDAGADGDYSGTGDNILYYTTDANMNVTALIDAATGAAIERYVYSPYGQVTVLQGTIDKDGTPTTDWSALTGNASAVANSILYCGYRFDGETGLYHVRYRMYDPSLGRWIQRDPAGYVDGMSLYEYGRGRVLTGIDPSGMLRLEWTEGTARAELAKQIAEWRGKGLNMAADLMQYFMDKKGPTDYVPTAANIKEVKEHGTEKIRDSIFMHVWSKTPELDPPDTGIYGVSITTTRHAASNIRWWLPGDDEHMLNAYGGADLNVGGRVTVQQMYGTFLGIFTVRTTWSWSGNVKVRLGDLYTWHSKSGVKNFYSRVRSDAYDAGYWLEEQCGYKPFYHEMQFDLEWKSLDLPSIYYECKQPLMAG